MASRTTDGVTAICRALQAAGIDCVFGVPGTQNVLLFDGFRRTGIRTVLASHELAAAFMANGYFRATGRLAALATIPGPGFTYALTGIAEARLDSAGLLYLVGKASTAPGRRFQLQAIDQRAIAAPLVKATLVLDAPDKVASIIAEACATATSGEPGPVMVELDFDALSGGGALVDPPATPVRAVARDAKLDQLKELFERAERPVFLLGQGALASASRLQSIAEAHTIPILTTPSARGIVAEDHPLVLGFDTLRGRTIELNRLLDQSDLVLGLGCKLTHNGSAGFELRLPPDRFVHVDASAEVPAANYEPLLGLVARVEDVMADLETPRAATQWHLDELQALSRLLRSAPDDAPEPVYHGRASMKPAEFFAWLRALLPRDAIVVTDSGLHQILTRRHFDALAPRGLIFPSDFQSMGFGLPAAIGAKLGVPERMVVALIGDGGFLMSGLELLTARREGVRLVVFVFNDGQLNQIRLQQWANFGHAHAVELLNPNYSTLCAGLGVRYLKFGEEGPTDIRDALEGDTPVLIEVVVSDSFAMRAVPAIARAKEIARDAIGPGLRDWLKSRLKGRKPA